jgi:hypothetical protein
VGVAEEERVDGRSPSRYFYLRKVDTGVQKYYPCKAGGKSMLNVRSGCANILGCVAGFPTIRHLRGICTSIPIAILTRIFPHLLVV